MSYNNEPDCFDTGLKRKYLDGFIMPGLYSDRYVSTRQDAVQKGRLPKSPLEGSMVDQLAGMNHQQQQQQVMSPYTNMQLRADNLVRMQQQQQQQQQQHPFNFNNTSSGNDSYEVATRLLYNVVEWARNVPFFSALSTTDQLALLKSSWSELYILNTSQHCAVYQINPRNLVPITDHQINDQRKRMDETISMDYSYKVFEELVEKFKNLQTDPAEFSCLKALVLFNPDSPGIGNPSLIESLQEKAQAALEDYLRQQTSANYANRFGKLLLRLPALSLIRPTTIESLFFSRMIGNHTVDNLVGSMLVYGSCNTTTTTTNNNNNNNIPIINNSVQVGEHGLGMNINNGINMHGNMGNVLNQLNGNMVNFQANGNNMNSMNGINTLQSNLQNTHFNGIPMHYQTNSLNNNSANIGLNNGISTPNGNFNVAMLNNQQSMLMNKPVTRIPSNTETRDPPKMYVKTESPPR